MIKKNIKKKDTNHNLTNSDKYELNIEPTNFTPQKKPLLIGLLILFLISIMTPSFQINGIIFDDEYSILNVLLIFLGRSKLIEFLFIFLFSVALPIINILVLIKITNSNNILINTLAAIFLKYKFAPVIVFSFILALIEFGLFGEINNLKGIYMYMTSISVITYFNWRIIPELLPIDFQRKTLDDIESIKLKSKQTIKSTLKVLSKIAAAFLIIKITAPLVMNYINKPDMLAATATTPETQAEKNEGQEIFIPSDIGAKYFLLNTSGDDSAREVITKRIGIKTSYSKRLYNCSNKTFKYLVKEIATVK